MLERMRSSKRLSTTLFSTILTYSIILVICFATIFSASFYFSHERNEEDRLLDIARSASAIMDTGSEEGDMRMLDEQFESGIRYTVIAPDGSVIFDSADSKGRPDPGSSDAVQEDRVIDHPDHSDRPEVQLAFEKGAASVVRHSTTLGEDTVYAAIVLDSGYILRLSEQRSSFLSVLGTLMPSFGLALLVVVVLGIGVSRLLTRKIVSPLTNIDAAHPLESSTYSEMEPLLHRIHDQQQQLIEQNRELDRAENLRKEFSANVTHEMKTPLQVISGYSELLAKGSIPPEDVQRFSKIIQEESSNMANLIDDILTLSRLDDSVLENAGKEGLDIFELAKDAVLRLSPLAEKHNVKARVLGSSMMITGNKGLIDQLITNLVSNAIKYSEPGRDVVVSVGKRVISLDGEEDPEVYIKVRDEGCGIPEEDQDKVFERFYRVDKSRTKESGGTGLGLAIAKHAAEFHGATISVDSAPGKGSVFTVHFPMRADI